MRSRVTAIAHVCWTRSRGRCCQRIKARQRTRSTLLVHWAPTSLLCSSFLWPHLCCTEVPTDLLACVCLSHMSLAVATAFSCLRPHAAGHSARFSPAFLRYVLATGVCA